MSKKTNTWAFLWWAVGWRVIGFVVAITLTSCKTRYITLHDIIRDTTYQTRIDTFTRYIVRSTVDTLLLHDSVTIYKDVTGKVERVEVWRDVERVRIERDTVDLYKARYDSLAAIHAQKQDVPVPVAKKTPSWMRQLKYMAIAISLLAISLFVIRYVRRSRDGI